MNDKLGRYRATRPILTQLGQHDSAKNDDVIFCFFSSTYKHCGRLKQDLNFENYLINLDKKHYLSLIKFRAGTGYLSRRVAGKIYLYMKESVTYVPKKILVMNIIICFVVVILSQKENVF